MRNRTLGEPACLAAIRRIGPDIVRLMDDDHSLNRRMEIAAMRDKHLPRNAGQRDQQIPRAKALDALQFHIDIALYIIHTGIVGCP